MDENSFEEQESQDTAQNQQSNQNGSGGTNVGHRAADAAKGVAKNAGKVGDKLGSKAEKFQNKANAQKAIAKSNAGTRTGVKATTKAKKLEQKSEKIKKAAEKAKKVQQKAEKFAKIAAKIGKIITFFGVFILILLIIIGLLVFIISGWGMLLSGFKAIAEKFYDTCFAIMNGGENNVKDDDIVNLMKNIEEMGYDLYGYGFVGADNVDDNRNHVYYTQDEEGKGELIEPLEDIDAYRNLVAYLISDNYAYYVKNSNFNFRSMFSGSKYFFGGIFNNTAWGSGLISIYEQEGENDEITGIKGDPYGISMGEHTAFAGLGAAAGAIIPIPGIGSVIGAGVGELINVIKNYDEATSSIEVNRGSKTLEITSIGAFHNKILSYSLDGWTGRYSMPLEFLLATHIATMAPDLSYKLATTFNTDVEILLWKSEGNTVQGGIQVGGNIIKSEQLNTYFIGGEKASHYLEGGNNTNTSSPSGAANQDPGKIENQVGPTAKSDTCPLVELGIPEPAGCTCGTVISTENESTTESGSTTTQTQTIEVFCKICQDYLTILKNATVAVNESKFSTYVPYLNKVTDHWFRDVYFTAGAMNEAGVTNVVKTDENYYQSTGEMWTEYEKDADGEYELYVYLKDDTGNYKSSFEQSDDKYLVCRKEKNGKGAYKISEKAGNLYEKDANGKYNLYLLKDANAEDKDKKYEKYEDKNIKEFRVGKKAVTETKEADWNVYKLDSTPSESGWTPFEIKDDSKTAIKAMEDIEGATLVYNLESTSGKITQTEDGVRGETHPETKKMFLDDYYLYNGSGPTAAKIEAAKDAVANKIMKDNGYQQGQEITLSKKPTYASNYASGTNSTTTGSNYGQNPDGTANNSQAINEDKKIILQGGRTGLQTLIDLHNAAYIPEIKGLEDIDIDDPDTYRKILGNQKITATYEGKTQTATIDEISGPINILHNSLTAFSILKNMHTLDAEYIYHDFKELIVELDYFDKEDLTDAEREVMMFPIAGLSSAGWPMARYDKSEEFYGTLLHSADDYKALKLQTIAELNQSGINIDITQPNEEETTEQNDRSDGSQTTKQTLTGHITYESIPANNSIDKCQTKSVVNGIEFYDYKQGSGSEWASKSYWGSTMADAGCGPTSTAIVLSGYGMNVTPDVIADEMVSDTTLEKVATSLERHGVPVGYYRSYGKTGSDAQNCINDILEAFNQGKPVICLVGNGSDGYFTGGGHFMVLLGITEDGTLIISNPGKLSEKQSYTSLEEFVKNYMTHSNTRPNRGIVVPANAPDGSTYTVSSEEFSGYKGGEEVISPVTGEVIKYGTVERTNMELVNAGVAKEDAKDTVGFIKIRVLGDKECKPGDVCDYFSKIEGAEGYNYFWEEYADAGITNHVLYIEGFDVTEILKNDIDSNSSTKGKNINKLKEYIEKDESDFYTTEYEVPKIVDKTQEEELQKKEDAKKDALYVIKDKEGKIYIKEGAVIGHTYTQDKAKTVDKEVKTYDENQAETTSSYKVGNYMRIIFRDADDQVVENVENYMELEKPTQETICGVLDDLGPDATADEKVKAAVTYFVSQGFTVEAACGIIGNLIQESGLDPAAVSSSGYRGLVQWDKDGRWPAVKTWMVSMGYDENDFSGQIKAIYECEYNQMPPNRWEELKKLTDVEKAAELFAVYDERCTGGADEPVWYKTGSKYQNLTERKSFAQNALKTIKAIL